LRKTWAPRGQTPILHHRYSRERLSAISALTVSPIHQRPGGKAFDETMVLRVAHAYELHTDWHERRPPV